MDKACAYFHSKCAGNYMTDGPGVHPVDVSLADPEDATQDALIRCMRVLHLWDPCTASAFTFFTTVAHNKQRDANRSERRQRAPALLALRALAERGHIVDRPAPPDSDDAWDDHRRPN